MLAWEQLFIDSLFAENAGAALQEAHRRLTTAGYKVLGYHGTSLANAKRMVPDKLDPRMAGTGAGLARGPGFYIAGKYSLAADYADESTQAGDPDERTGIVPRKEGEAGTTMVLRVYGLCLNRNCVGAATPQPKGGEAQSSSLTALASSPAPQPKTPPTVFAGKRAWGLQSSSGDPNQDKRLPGNLSGLSGTLLADKTKELFKQNHDLEMVVASGAYPHLAVIPSLMGDADQMFLGSWGALDDASALALRGPKSGVPRNTSAPAPTDLLKLDFSRVAEDRAASSKLRSASRKLGAGTPQFSQEAPF